MIDFSTELFNRFKSLGDTFDNILMRIKSKNITKSQAILIFCIHECKEISINELSSRLNLNQGNTSSLCKKMEKQGLLVRTRNKSDERIVNVSLGDEGVKETKFMMKKVNELKKELENYDIEKLKSIVNGLKNLDEMLKNTIDKGEKNVRD